MTAAYGEYLVYSYGCNVCNGADLGGGKSSDPASPPAPNLTPGGELGNWSLEDFTRTLRTGVNPASGC